MLILTPTGTLKTITPGRRWSDGAWHWTGNETAETLAAHGYLVQADPPAPVPTLAALQPDALARYRAEAAQVLDTHVPAPWDRLRDVATAEYAAWIDALRAEVAAELDRLETAVANAATADELAAIVADWPEVTL